MFLNRKILPILFAGFLALWMLAACSGGGGSANSASSSETGTVALLVKDGPAEDYESITIFITKAALLPADENAAPVVVFESEDIEGVDIDLLAHREEPYLLDVSNVPAGTYAKIRLWVADIVPKLPNESEDSQYGALKSSGSCADFDIKLPSGKIDLKPRGTFEVVPGQALAIELDVDLDKSINLHPAGNSGKCIFRPVIFVNIYDYPSVMPRCPSILSGTIETLLKDDDENVIGFEMLPAKWGKHKVPVTVVLNGETSIFGEDGSFAGPEALYENAKVKVRGWLNDSGEVEASLVVVGEVSLLAGTVESAVEADGDSFSMVLDSGQVIVMTDPLQVQLAADQTLVLMGCDEPVAWDAIQEDMRVKVVGKYDADAELFRAVAVLLKPREITGMLVSIEEQQESGSLLIIDTGTGGEPVKIFMPDTVCPHVKNDGFIPGDILTALLDCEPRAVVVKLDPHQPEMTARDVALIPEKISGVVLEFPDGNNSEDSVMTVEIDEQAPHMNIRVSEFTRLLYMDDGKFQSIDFEDIKVEDRIVSFGFEDCVEAGELDRQISFLVLVMKPESTE